jgi:hypothetical protein
MTSQQGSENAIEDQIIMKKEEEPVLSHLVQEKKERKNTGGRTHPLSP